MEKVAEKNQENLKKDSTLRFGNLYVGLSGLIVALNTAMIVGYADMGVWGDVAGKLDMHISDLSAALYKIILSVAGVVMLFCGLVYLFASDQKKVDQAKYWFVRIFLGVVVTTALGFIIELAVTIGQSF